MLAVFDHLGLVRHWDEEVAGWALLVQLGSWFQFYCLPRTFSNSLEAVILAQLSAWHVEQDLGRAIYLPRLGTFVLSEVRLS
eukprot:1372806-Amphidinium_carterae.1